MLLFAKFLLLSQESAPDKSLNQDDRQLIFAKNLSDFPKVLLSNVLQNNNQYELNHYFIILVFDYFSFKIRFQFFSNYKIISLYFIKFLNSDFFFYYLMTK